MTKRKRKPVVWIVDDDEYNRNAYKTDLGDVADVYSFEALYDTWGASAPPPAVVIVDLSSIDPFMQGAHMVYSQISQIGENHPGAVLLIASQVSRNYADEVVDRVKQASDCIVEAVYHGGGDFFQRVVEAVKAKL